MKYDFAVIGANGMQGRIASRDLLERGYSVLLCAIDTHGLEKLLDQHAGKSGYVYIDLRNMQTLRDALTQNRVEVIVNCAMDDYNLDVTKLALELGVHYLDLDAMIPMMEEQEKLHSDFAQKGLTAILGCGSTPGINNVMISHVVPRFDTIHTVDLGFAWNSNMEVFIPPFSIDAIMYEFAEPAFIYRNGEYVKVFPSDPTGIEHEYMGIGRQATRYTEHTEHHSLVNFLRDKGIKNVAVYSSFPDHSHRVIQTLLDIGMLDKKPVLVDGKPIVPLQAAIDILRQIKLPEGYTEKENLWVKVYGTKDGKEHVEEMDCMAYTLPGWEDATCNIDTGFPMAIGAMMIKNGEIAKPGVYAPEAVVPPEPFFRHLADHQLEVYDNGKRIN